MAHRPLTVGLRCKVSGTGRLVEFSMLRTLPYKARRPKFVLNFGLQWGVWR